MTRDQKFALVTGCGKGGIGEALILEYTRRGIYAIATVLPTENSDHLTVAGITWFPLDVTDEQSVVDLKKSIASVTDGYLDFLVNNAGICYTMTAIDTDATGTIVNIGSIGGVVPYMYGAAWFWTGSATGIIKFLDMFAWRTIWDFFFYREFNLGKVKDAYLANLKKDM
ncbi:hypothetical protein TrVFT333_006197 [Trichoderma virens FT-333]|nr:hypothetical protein TrVFT333_006197 [Trichoderma virens FT-333]